MRRPFHRFISSFVFKLADSSLPTITFARQKRYQQGKQNLWLGAQLLEVSWDRPSAKKHFPLAQLFKKALARLVYLEVIRIGDGTYEPKNSESTEIKSFEIMEE